MRSFFPALLMTVLCAVPLFGQHEPAATEEHAEVPAGEVAHGSEEVAHEQVHEGAAAEGEHGGEHEAKSYFGIPGWILKLLNMILFAGLLIYFLKRPVMGMFAERRRKIRKDLEEAETRRQKADSLAADIQGRLSQIEAEVATILERAREEGERQKQQILETAQQESQKILAVAQSQIDQRVKQARRELTEYAGELATERAQRLLAESITDADRSQLFQESVDRIAGGER
ncbi:MAG TPA: F0F1 ATP synthase subunit B [Thermoanaerobaculia bacterium]|nr:F0F1 ATP synthase subunit B [Thermoanaerobaculia bacterium]